MAYAMYSWSSPFLQFQKTMIENIQLCHRFFLNTLQPFGHPTELDIKSLS